jgi:Mg-chelatase subunit ChlI
MTNNSMKQTRTLVRNGYGVETSPQYLMETFPMYDRATRTRILNDMDAASDSFDGETSRETADNLALRMKLEAMHQALTKANYD